VAEARRTQLGLYIRSSQSVSQSSAPAVTPARASRRSQRAAKPSIARGSNRRQPRLVKDVVDVRQTTISFSGRAPACSRCQPAALSASSTSEVMGRANRELAGWAGLAASTVEPTDRRAGPSTTTASSAGSGRAPAVGIDFCRSSSSSV